MVLPRLCSPLHAAIDDKGTDNKCKEVVNLGAALEGGSGINNTQGEIFDSTTSPNIATVRRLVDSGGEALKSSIITGARVIDDRKEKTHAALKESIASGSVIVEHFLNKGKEAAVLGLEKSIEGIVNEPGKYSGPLRPGDEVFSVETYFFGKGNKFREDMKRDGVCCQRTRFFGVHHGKLVVHYYLLQAIFWYMYTK